MEMPVIAVDHDYLDTFGFNLILGRDFSPEYSTDAKRTAIINETAMKKFGWEVPLGKKFKYRRYEEEIEVVGVIRDTHFESLRREIGPCVFIYDPSGPSAVAVRLSEHDIPATIEYIEKTWYEFSPNYTFWHSFLDQTIEATYYDEGRIGKILRFASIFAVLIACLGLFGLATFDTERRIKEIGIRKVLGASVFRIAFLLSKDFLGIVLIANVLAWPIAYYFGRKWLQGFAYRPQVTLWIPIGAALISIVIAVLTVNIKTILAARANPLDTLRYE